MKHPPIKDKFFSSTEQGEQAFRFLYWLLFAALIIILFLFWEPLRSTGFTYSMVSFTVGNLAVAVFFRIVTTLGSEGFFLALFSVIYWSYNKNLGFWGLIVMPVSLFITSEIPKDIIRLPRPDVRGVSVPTYTFPSGHTTGAVAVWGYLAVRLQNKWFWICALLVMVLVGLSRVMLGYHFPGDVLGGFVTGMFFLAVFFRIKTWMDRQNRRTALFKLRLTAALILPLAASFIPASFAPNLMGYVTGAGVGYLLERERLGFIIRGDWRRQLGKAAVGLPVIAGIISGLNLVLPADIHLLTFTQHALATLWVTYLAPQVFVRLGLTRYQLQF